MKSPKEIGITVRRLRGDMSLRDFAKLCGVSHSTIDYIEKGYDFRTGRPSHPSALLLNKIAKAANVPLSYIVGDNGEKDKSALNNRALSEGYIVFHRNGKNMKVKFNPEQQKMFDFLTSSAEVQEIEIED